MEAWIGQEMHLLEAPSPPTSPAPTIPTSPSLSISKNADIFTDGNQCRVTVLFDEVLPLDTVASITIGDLTIPLPDA